MHTKNARKSVRACGYLHSDESHVKIYILWIETSDETY